MAKIRIIVNFFYRKPSFGNFWPKARQYRGVVHIFVYPKLSRFVGFWKPLDSADRSRWLLSKMQDKSWFSKTIALDLVVFKAVGGGGGFKPGPILAPGFLVVVDVLYLRHWDEHGPLLILLADVGQPAEDEHPHDHHQHQQPELLVAAQTFTSGFSVFKGTWSWDEWDFLCRTVDW